MNFYLYWNNILIMHTCFFLFACFFLAFLIKSLLHRISNTRETLFYFVTRKQMILCTIYNYYNLITIKIKIFVFKKIIAE